MTLQDRIDSYHRITGWPQSLWIGGDGRIVGMFIMGQNYTVKSGYYGGYPHGYLKRINALFPDVQKTLHLFSGAIPKGDYTRFDRLPENADVTGDAHNLSAHLPGQSFDLVCADPPYSVEDCEHYGCAMVNRNKVLAECCKVVQPGGFIVWLDQVLPMFRKVELKMVGVIGMVKSTNHRFRVVTILQRI